MRSGKCVGSRLLCANACFGQPTHSPTIPARPASARCAAPTSVPHRVGDYRSIYEIPRQCAPRARRRSRQRHEVYESPRCTPPPLAQPNRASRSSGASPEKQRCRSLSAFSFSILLPARFSSSPCRCPAVQVFRRTGCSQNGSMSPAVTAAGSRARSSRESDEEARWSGFGSRAGWAACKHRRPAVRPHHRGKFATSGARAYFASSSQSLSTPPRQPEPIHGSTSPAP